MNCTGYPQEFDIEYPQIIMSPTEKWLESMLDYEEEEYSRLYSEMEDI